MVEVGSIYREETNVLLIRKRARHLKYNLKSYHTPFNNGYSRSRSASTASQYPWPPYSAKLDVPASCSILNLVT
jgi:hypothetical protein